MILYNKKDSKDPTIANTAIKIIKDRKKICLRLLDILLVIYQVRDYEGYPCQEGDKDSQKIFLTYNLKDNFIYNDLQDPPDDLINQKEGPIISEEFLSYMVKREQL